VRFGNCRVYTDRRQAADATHDEIVGLRELSAMDAQPAELAVQ
jgi:hypothetical protein